MEHVQAGGLDYLVKRWTQGCRSPTTQGAPRRRIATHAEYGAAEWIAEEWMNDLDVREILQDLFDHVPESHVARQAVEAADARFAASTTATDACQWGEINASRHGWTREKHWWYWRKPPTPYL